MSHQSPRKASEAARARARAGSHPTTLVSQVEPAHDPADAFRRLSATETDQLGRERVLSNGKISPYRFVPGKWWPTVRAYMLEQSRRAAQRARPDFVLPERMTAYTPGETVQLLQEPEVTAWHRSMQRFAIPTHDALGRPLECVAFVPCAKTKPWDTARTGLYGAYNAVRAQVRAGVLPATYFVTISEPLGVVPERHWGDFVQYDNPGLFSEEMLRSGGIMTADWQHVTPAKEKFVVPFDGAAYEQAIDLLGHVIAGFLRFNARRLPGVRWVSFVDSMDRSLSTHGDMLNHVLEELGPSAPVIERFRKKAETRIPPLEHVVSVLQRTAPPPPRRQPGVLHPASASRVARREAHRSARREAHTTESAVVMKPLRAGSAPARPSLARTAAERARPGRPKR